MYQDLEQDVLMPSDEGSAGEAEAVAVAPASCSRKLRCGVLASAGFAFVLVGASLGPGLRARLREGAILGLAGQPPAMEVCRSHEEHPCPASFLETGGYHCKLGHGGCRPERDGPFPESSCKTSDQCHLIKKCDADLDHQCPTAFYATGGYHCKGHGGCRLDHQGPFPAGSCDHNDQCYIKSEDIVECGADVSHECPPSYLVTGGYHCTTHKGCRSKAQGPFGQESCANSDQCYLSGVNTGVSAPMVQ